MSRLEEIKNKYAKEFDYGDWISFINDQPSWGIEGHMNDICKLYAKEVAQASLEKASKAAEVIEPSDSDYCSYVDKESITNESNIVLL